MEKRYLSPLELLKIARSHADCAEHLLRDKAELDALDPFVSLMHMAFELTLKAYLAQAYKTKYQHKNLQELLELSTQLGLSKEDLALLKKLSRQYVFRKGLDYELWENKQQLQVFC